MVKPLYRDLTAMLSEAGFVLHRKGKGSHEIWRRQSDGKQLTLARTIKSQVSPTKS
jgi:predicted RNA binding protein YcfA (HicA-like mRNA interferase family)